MILKGTFTLPPGGDLNTSPITVDIGGVARTFTPTGGGRFTSATNNERFQTKIQRNGITVLFAARFRRGDFQQELSDENLGNSVIFKENRSIKVLLLFNNTILSEHVELIYRNGNGSGRGSDFSGI